VPQFLPKSTWNSVRNLFISGVSLGEIHRRTGIKKSTLCARAAREKWTQARQETETLKAQVVPYDPDAEMLRVTTENARETCRYMSEYLMKAARKLAEGGDFPVPRTVEEAALLERIRSNLWPQPTLIDRRSVSVNIAQQGQGLSPEAIEKLEAMLKLM
jgi:hypothetical protein